MVRLDVIDSHRSRPKATRVLSKPFPNCPNVIVEHGAKICDSEGLRTFYLKESNMAKGLITKKTEKKPPLQTPKEKKAAKQAKKAGKK